VSEALDTSAERNQEMVDEAMAELTIEELQEFLQADLLDVPVDPVFKEQLKQRLWELVQAQVRGKHGSS
jgi:hypothetical protein